MKHRRVKTVLIGGVILAACGNPSAPESIDVPQDLQPVAITIGTVRNETPPSTPLVSLLGTSGGVRFMVTRENLCAMLASGGFRIESIGNSTITIVTTVSANPAALCAAGLARIDYQGVVPATPGRTYEVRFYEQVADRRAQLLGTARVVAQ